MRRLTLDLDDSMFEAAREKARAEGTTLEALLRGWLADYLERENRSAESLPDRGPADRFDEIMDRLAPYRAAGSWSRDGANERRTDPGHGSTGS